MGDADGRMIPWVEDDQGEGIKDFFDILSEAKDAFDKGESECEWSILPEPPTKGA